MQCSNRHKIPFRSHTNQVHFHCFWSGLIWSITAQVARDQTASEVCSTQFGIGWTYSHLNTRTWAAVDSLMIYTPVPSLALTSYDNLTLFNHPFLTHAVGTYGGSEVPFAQLNAAVLSAKSPTACYFIGELTSSQMLAINQKLLSSLLSGININSWEQCQRDMGWARQRFALCQQTLMSANQVQSTVCDCFYGDLLHFWNKCEPKKWICIYIMATHAVHITMDIDVCVFICIHIYTCM